MRRFIKGFRHREKGFTLIELLIVVAILGIIAAVVIPNVTGFMTTGSLNAANTEAMNVKTAAIGYYAENGSWATTTTDANGGVLDPYLTGALKAVYTFSSTAGEEGLIESTSMIGDGWGTGITFYEDTQKWEKTRTA